LWLGIDRKGQLVLTGGHVVAGRPVEVFGIDSSSPAGSVRCGEKPGFWCGYDGSVTPNSMIFVGYVVGDVASVRINVDGRVHRAKTAAWSANPQLPLWWLSLPTPANGLFGTVSAMTARIGQDRRACLGRDRARIAVPGDSAETERVGSGVVRNVLEEARWEHRPTTAETCSR
jgi:hypothetical protein